MAILIPILKQNLIYLMKINSSLKSYKKCFADQYQEKIMSILTQDWTKLGKNTVHLISKSLFLIKCYSYKKMNNKVIFLWMWTKRINCMMNNIWFLDSWLKNVMPMEYVGRYLAIKLRKVNSFIPRITDGTGLFIVMESMKLAGLKIIFQWVMEQDCWMEFRRKAFLKIMNWSRILFVKHPKSLILINIGYDLPQSFIL